MLITLQFIILFGPTVGQAPTMTRSKPFHIVCEKKCLNNKYITTYIYIYIYTHTHVYVYIYIYLYIYIYIYVTETVPHRVREEVPGTGL